MVPVDAELHEPADLKKAAVSLDSWLDQINRLKFKRAVIIIDGSPVHFPGEVTEGARVPGGNNIFVALSTSQGRPSANGKTGEHSPLAMAFLEALVAPSQSVVGMFNDIRTRVWDGLPQRWEPKLWGNPEAWQSISLLATPASPPMQHEPEETPLALSHDFDVSEFPYTPKQGTVRPAATLNHAIRWTKWWDGHPPPGWHQIELTGWLVVRGKDGYAYAVDGNGFWNVSNQRKENGSATTALNLHATAALDAENIIATVSEGTGVWELGRLMIDGREWLRCQWTCHINDGTAAPFDPYRPGEPYEADLTFPSSDHAPTISHRVFRFRSSAEPLEMSFTNHRDCAGPDKHGRALLEGTWTGMTFISHSQKMLDGYKNWINETIVVHLNDAAYAGAGSVSVEFPRKGATVRVEAYLHGNAEKARKGKGP